MDNSTIEQRVLWLEKEIKRHDELYYGHSRPEITDSEYDRLILELRAIVETSKVKSELFEKPGFSTPSTHHKEVRHIRPMISLRTEVETTRKPIEDFVRRTREAGYTGSYVSEAKYDGVALSLRWENNSLVGAILRGDGEYGEDIIENVFHISNIDSTLTRSLSGADEIRGEVVLPRQLLSRINELRVQDGKPEFVNCRNAVSGILRAIGRGTKLLELLVFKPYCVFGCSDIVTQSEAINRLADQFHIGPAKVLDSVEDLYCDYLNFTQTRSDLEYDIDGVVFKVNDLSWQDKLGVINREPRWAIAHKFTAEEAVTELLAIDIDVGQTGRITPVARVRDVFVGGVTVSNITLSNVFQIRRKGIRIGDKIIVRRAGDVIPEIIGTSAINYRSLYVPNFHMPEQCPACKSLIRRPKGQANYICGNTECSGQIAGKFTHIAQRQILDIEGLGPGVAILLQANGVNKISQLLNLSAEDIRKAGVGDANAKKLFNELQRVKATALPMDKAIRALAVANIGEGASKKLGTYYKTPEMLYELRADTVNSIPELNKTEKANIIRYLTDNLQETKDILSSLTIESSQKFEGPLSGMTIVFTGTDPNLDKATLKEIAEQNGGTVNSSVSKTTSLVVYGFNAGDKLNKAGKYGINTMSTETFIAKYKDN